MCAFNWLILCHFLFLPWAFGRRQIIFTQLTLTFTHFNFNNDFKYQCYICFREGMDFIPQSVIFFLKGLPENVFICYIPIIYVKICYFCCEMQSTQLVPPQFLTCVTFFLFLLTLPTGLIHFTILTNLQCTSLEFSVYFSLTASASLRLPSSEKAIIS